ncbi:hypothetical protein ACGYLO_16690 [Sulfitobacter sp. 1A13353]|uniref:hypothetical protein n=1 Tax=Sulfitobacter sp. 1A13353 TaxID=3368568 RepID=UPI003745A5F7
MTNANALPIQERLRAVQATCEEFGDGARPTLTLVRDAADRIDALEKALRGCLNYMENTEAEFGITLDSADAARAALGEGE